jgi:hypothetical protein
MCTMMAGVMLSLLGATGMGTAVNFIPRPVVVGFTNGIGVLIASTQIKDFSASGRTCRASSGRAWSTLARNAGEYSPAARARRGDDRDAARLAVVSRAFPATSSRCSAARRWSRWRPAGRDHRDAVRRHPGRLAAARRAGVQARAHPGALQAGADRPPCSAPSSR